MLEHYCAVFPDRFLLDGVHLSLQLRNLRGILFVALNEKRARPEYDNRNGGRHRILGDLTVLRSGCRRGGGRYALRLFRQLWTGERLILQW